MKLCGNNMNSRKSTDEDAVDLTKLNFPLAIVQERCGNAHGDLTL